jgi:ribosome-binding protein aMBF1 (putative translation factor)
MSKQTERGMDAWNQTIRRAAKATGLSVYALAQRAGLRVAPVQKFLAGEGGLTVTSAGALGPIIGVELVWKQPTAGKAKRASKARA